MTPLDLGRLYDEHAQALFAFLLNFTRHEADSRDVLQELFLKLARRPDQLDRVAEPRAFLIRLAHNLAVDAVRRRARAPPWTDRTAQRTHSQRGAAGTGPGGASSCEPIRQRCRRSSALQERYPPQCVSSV